MRPGLGWGSHTSPVRPGLASDALHIHTVLWLAPVTPVSTLSPVSNVSTVTSVTSVALMSLAYS